MRPQGINHDLRPTIALRHRQIRQDTDHRKRQQQRSVQHVDDDVSVYSLAEIGSQRKLVETACIPEQYAISERHQPRVTMKNEKTEKRDNVNIVSCKSVASRKSLDYEFHNLTVRSAITLHDAKNFMIVG